MWIEKLFLAGVFALLLTFVFWGKFFPASALPPASTYAVPKVIAPLTVSTPPSVTPPSKVVIASRAVFPPPVGSPPQGMVSLNFDDGFLSAYEIAFPILEKAGMRGTLYPISRYMEPPLYLTQAQALNIQSRGHEIGVHTRSHLHLNTLMYSEIRDEVTGAKEDLEKMGFQNVDTFAYPYGEYNSMVLAAVKDAGFIAARGTRPGFNDTVTDRFQLQSKSIEQGRSVEEIRRLIDQAVQEKKWLILAFHRIDDESSPINASSEMLQQIVDYLIEKKVPVITMREGYELVLREE